MAKPNFLDPSSELTVGALSATLVYSIFAINAPNLADVRYAEPGNTNTYKSVNTATYTAAATVAALAILSKSPTVFIIGGAMTLFEAWKYHFANFGNHGSQEAPTVSTTS
jgi:hypothetical protein